MRTENQLLLYKPNFLVFNYTSLELSEIRWALYESYQMVAYNEDGIPEFEALTSDSLPIDEIYNRLISEICFDDTEEYTWMVDEQVDAFEGEQEANGWKISHDFGEILMMDHVSFIDLSKVTHNMPLVHVW
jgi:hypothetical protein